MWTVRRVTIAVIVLVAAIIAVAIWYFTRPFVGESLPGCTIANINNTSDESGDFAITPTQADNAATIAAIGVKLGMPDHAVTVALATALQESDLVNLPGGDQDSAGLFQQRPSQGWGSYAQVTNPIYAATAFYQHLRAIPGWEQLSVTEAAQTVQRSAAPDAYAQWESEARAMASALTGETAAALACHNLTITPSHIDVATTAESELGTTALSGSHDTAHGWAIGSWLVAHASRLGINRVTFSGRTWTAAAGAWSQTGPADGVLTFQQESTPTSTSEIATN